MKELLTFLLVIAIHETGHVLATVLCGAKIRRFLPIFGGFRIEFDGVERMSYFRELLVYSGGVIFNLFSLLIPFAGERFRVYSIGAAVYNLLPFAGSDGGGILYITVLYFSGSPFIADRVRRISEDSCLFFLWCFCVYLNLCGKGSLPILLSVILLIFMRIKKENRDL